MERFELLGATTNCLALALLSRRVFAFLRVRHKGDEFFPDSVFLLSLGAMFPFLVSFNWDGFLPFLQTRAPCG